MSRLYRALPLVLLIGGCQGPSTPDRQSSGPPGSPPSGPNPSAPRPNVVVIVTDDLRWDEFAAAGHPYVETPHIDRLAAEGAMFVNSFHAVPLCSPNRASILTGQYPSRHGIIDNVARNLASHRLTTFPMAMREQGYDTAFLGKWHMGNDPTPRPGFNYWVGLPGQGRAQDPELFEDGSLHVVTGYVTDLLTDRAIDFIGRQRGGPFLLYLAHKAVHPDVRQRDDGSVDTGSSLGYVPAPRHRGRYEARTYERRPNAVPDPDGLAGKPALRRALAYRASADITARFGGILDLGTSETTIRRRAEMLLAVDESLGRLIAALEKQGVLDTTMIVFTSDNGFFFGEHGLSLERRLPYEESIRGPLLVRYPPLVGAGVRPLELVLSVDIAPTVLEAAGVPIRPHIQGRSLVPLLRGASTPWRQSLLVEFYSYENPMPWLADMDYRAIRTRRHKYIRWIKHPDLDELYDLEADPYELRNLVDDPASAQIKARLKRDLGRLVLESMELAERR
jgi:arylsulfatase A-like enzyme